MLKKARNLRTRYIASAVVPLVMVTSALISRENLTDFDQVTDNLNVIGQRGCLPAGAEAYPEPYNRSLATVDEYVDPVTFLTADNVSPQRLSSLAIREQPASVVQYVARLCKSAETLDHKTAAKFLKVFTETVRYFS